MGTNKRAADARKESWGAAGPALFRSRSRSGGIRSSPGCARTPESASEETPARRRAYSSARTPVSDRRPVGGVSQFLSQFRFRADPLARKQLILKTRRDVRVVEGARLESNSGEAHRTTLERLVAQSLQRVSAVTSRSVCLRNSECSSAPSAPRYTVLTQSRSRLLLHWAPNP